MSRALLANIAWHSLTGLHAAFSSGSATARRTLKGFTPIIAFADAGHPDFAGLETLCQNDEHFYCIGWPGPTPPGWEIKGDAVARQMVWEGSDAGSEKDFPTVRLGQEHVPQMLALVASTRPGPFGHRSAELGEFFGIFDGSRLVAMAGECLAAAGLREISTVCTLPEYQGRGMARHLVETLIRRELQRHQTPFLHVMSDNVNACRLYERIGFRTCRNAAIRVITRSGAAIEERCPPPSARIART